jgi:hypothetical protein
MDIDDEDEVTREPFYDESDDEHLRDKCQPKLETFDEEQGPLVESINDGDDDDRSVSSLCSEDIKFAEAYNIQLQRSKQKAAALFESEFIDTGRNSKESNAKSSNEGVSNDARLIPTSVTSDCIHHRGVFLQTGDIVALCDQDDGQLYFAQLTGFVQDIYCEKSASVNWLVPIRPTSREIFDPADYKIGLEDTQLRKLDSMIFIRHSPSDYYLNNRCRESSNKLSEVDLRHYQKRGQPYIWTTMEPCRAPRVEPESDCQQAAAPKETQH